MTTKAKDRRLHNVAIILGILTMALLVILTIAHPPALPQLLPGFLFWLLITFTLAVGVPLAGGEASLQPMVVCAAYLVLGDVVAGWAVLLSAVTHGVIRWLRARRAAAPNPRRLLVNTAMNAAMHVLGVLGAGLAYRALGGSVPFSSLSLRNGARALLIAPAYLALNYAVAAGYMRLRGRDALQDYARSLGSILFYEAIPLAFTPLLAVTYTQLGPPYFVLLAAMLVMGSLVAQGLAQARQRLERRVQELDSLQVVGQALSASLDIETVFSAIYDQVIQLMPAEEFYIGLYDAKTDEVSFPLAVEGGERVQWRSRQRGQGLTEHILRTGEPLLLRGDVDQRLREMGLDLIGQLAACWLGVPIIAGGEPLGVISVQSPDEADAYDASHREVLRTIAAQAGVAIQNARLYARTDEALARRVQELDSILRTTGEGMLLLDLEWHVLAVNRALAEFLQLAQLDLANLRLDECTIDGQALTSLIRYPPEVLLADCETLATGDEEQVQALVLLEHNGRHMERTLTPVRDAEGAITRWLIVFRDISEEVALARLREDMTDMLVHDLRSPLTMVMGSIGLMKRAFTKGNLEEFEQLFTIAKRGNERMLHMINQLLDISRFESGTLPLNYESLHIPPILREIVARYAPAASTTHITIEMAVPPNLPPVCADRQLIARVLDNLLDNAIKFTPDGGHIRLWAHNQMQDDGELLHLGVSDNGPGIPTEEQARLFEKFEQGSTQGRRKGSGLGLHFCKLVVEAHGGSIWVESEVGRGSTFAVALPLDTQGSALCTDHLGDKG